jgi:hypothetical protein
MANKPIILSTLLLLFVVAAAPAVAADDAAWTLRLRGLSSDYRRDYVFAYFYTSHLVIDNGTGFEVAAEFRPRKHLGVELGVGRLEFDAKTWTTQVRPVSFDPLVLETVTVFEDRGSFVIQPWTLALMIHPYTTDRLDSYVAPFAAWARYDVRIESADRDPEPGYGAKLGLEYLFGRSPWSLGVEYRHLELVHENLDRDQYGDIGLDAGSLLVGYRFNRR